MSAVFPSVFVVDAKIIFGDNFEAPLINDQKLFHRNSLKNKLSINK